eukprot:TRINITY_DN4502_c0_g1_i1.p1 TRINITY_DN4502_c0_g1~~TRINITY_DN4502_c0_g1_i1.p1  ORF type:complete len:165 (-),score=29.98 TRINITY_DN4502_c0_g1_i1:60-527(-)
MTKATATKPPAAPKKPVPAKANTGTAVPRRRSEVQTAPTVPAQSRSKLPTAREFEEHDAAGLIADHFLRLLLPGISNSLLRLFNLAIFSLVLVLGMMLVVVWLTPDSSPFASLADQLKVHVGFFLALTVGATLCFQWFLFEYRRATLAPPYAGNQ